ncbi:MAG: hypothetical protein DHS20C18_28860 [Saprospiraceae bacterium]|nr:MAG: hypothetical protein DHS20C18_28860 [Saprospiraceae bacterium]
MKFNWKVLLAAILFTASFSSLMAQSVKKAEYDPAQRAEKQTASMVEKLGLNEEQAAQVKAINLDYGQKMQAARGEAQGDREAMKANMKSLKDGKNEALKGVLTADQFKQYTEMQDQKGRKGKHGKKMGAKSKKKVDRS